jgi:RNA polymerase sigma-70 factor, ECF subfamily
MDASRSASRDQDITAFRNPGPFEESINRGDSSLIELALAGDVQAFEALILRHRKRAYRSIHRITRHHEDTEDVLQDATLKVYMHLAGFEGRSQFGSWFIAIAINQALMLLRRRSMRESHSPRFAEETEESFPPDVPDNRPDAEAEIEHLELAYAIRRAARRLPHPLRVVFRKRFVDQMSTEETAEALNLSAAAVKSRVLRAKRHLRRQLGTYRGSSGGSV